MSPATGTPTIAASVPAGLVRGIVDDAATFPPGNAPMADSVEARAMYEDSWFAELLGAVVLRADRAHELLAALSQAGDARSSTAPLPVTVVVPGGLDTVADAVTKVTDPALHVVSLEVPLGPVRTHTDLVQRALSHLPPGARLFVEPSTGLDPVDVMPALATAGVGGKIRTGGTTAAAFPDEATVARFVHAAVAAGVPFKATAGLHNALRHRDEDTGFEHHGFVNLLAATAAALLQDASEHQVHVLLQATEPEPLLEVLTPLDDEQAAAVRRAFVSFGSCSTVEPVEDLAGLGLVARPAVGVGA